MEIKTSVAITELRKMIDGTRDSYKKSALVKALDALEMRDSLIFCPECKYYYAPVCTFYKALPMTSRSGFCYHAIKGKYEGEVPKVEVTDEQNSRGMDGNI